MAADPTERVNAPVSRPELERRWAAIRAAMEAAGVDVLVTQCNNDHMGGYVRYLTDIPAVNGYPFSVVFPREGTMSVVRHGPLGLDVTLEDDPVLRGVGRVLGTASFASVDYTKRYDAELALRALAPYARGRIGLVGTYQMGHAFASTLIDGLPEASFSDASELVDSVRMVKSAEEIEQIRRTAAVQDAAMAAAMDAVEPGRRDSEIAAIAQRVVQDLGGEQGIYLCASMAPGEPAQFGPRHMQERVMRAGDSFALLVETNGPGGQYAELGRSCVLGEPAESMLEEFEFVLEAQRATLALLTPGTPCASAFAGYNAFMREHGRPQEERLHCHSQGYDLVERPLIRADETFTVKPSMNITCHPGYLRGGHLSWACDNFLLGEDGAFERLHQFPQSIVSR